MGGREVVSPDRRDPEFAQTERKEQHKQGNGLFDFGSFQIRI